MQSSMHSPMQSYKSPAKRVSAHRRHHDIEALREMLSEVSLAADALYELHPEPASVEGLYVYMRDMLGAAQAKIARLGTL